MLAFVIFGIFKDSVFSQFSIDNANGTGLFDEDLPRNKAIPHFL